MIPMEVIVSTKRNKKDNTKNIITANYFYLSNSAYRLLTFISIEHDRGILNELAILFDRAEQIYGKKFNSSILEHKKIKKAILSGKCSVCLKLKALDYGLCKGCFEKAGVDIDEMLLLLDSASKKFQ